MSEPVAGASSPPQHPLDATQPAPTSTAAPITETLFGKSSAQALDHPDLIDSSEKDVPLTEQVPAQIKLNKHQDDKVPAVAPQLEEAEVPLDPGLADLGWSKDPSIPNPILHGLKNEDVWQLVRRFNKQTYHVKAITDEPHGGIDLNIADKDEFTPDKLRSTLERLYMTVGLSLAAFFKHIARLRSWQERRRTAFFLVIYVAAWFFDYLLAAFSSLIMLLLVSPRSRRVLFPPAPLAAISAKTGQVQMPKAGHLASDSLTGAKENYKGEAVEQEASNLVGSVTHLAVASAAGKGQTSVSQAKEDKDADSKGEPSNDNDPTDHKISAVDKLQSTSGEAALTDGVVKEDHTEEAVDDAVWSKAQVVLHALEDIADTWERFGNALSPVRPFHRHLPRATIAAVFAPIVLCSLFITSSMVYRGATLGIGFGFFGQPLIDLGGIENLVKLLDEKVPNWKSYLELRNTLLRGIPTNAQVTLTMLRIGEAAKSPLPPPPPSDATPPPPPAETMSTMPDDVPPEYEEDMKRVVEESRKQELEQDAQDSAQGDAEKKPKKQSKIMAFLKGTSKTTVEGGLTVDHMRAAVGSEHAKQRLGVVQKEVKKDAAGDGPTSFHARHKGVKGLVLISTTATTPCVSFEKEQPPHAKALMAAANAASDASSPGPVDDPNTDSKTVQKLKEAAEKARPVPLFSVAIDDIVGVKKLGGLGWKGKLAVEYITGKEIADGLEIEDRAGANYIITAMPRRDEVFNRLIAMSEQTKWELW